MRKNYFCTEQSEIENRFLLIKTFLPNHIYKISLGASVEQMENLGNEVKTVLVLMCDLYNKFNLGRLFQNPAFKRNDEIFTGSASLETKIVYLTATTTILMELENICTIFICWMIVWINRSSFFNKIIISYIMMFYLWKYSTYLTNVL